MVVFYHKPAEVQEEILVLIGQKKICRMGGKETVKAKKYTGARQNHRVGKRCLRPRGGKLRGNIPSLRSGRILALEKVRKGKEERRYKKLGIGGEVEQTKKNKNQFSSKNGQKVRGKLGF